MNTLIFAGGIMVGALVTFAFVFIVSAIATNKKGSSKMNNPISEDLIKELWHEYMKEMRDDGK